MTPTTTFSARRTRWMNRFHAKRSARARPATGFVSSPEPRTIGQIAKGRQLLAGNVLLAGYLVEWPDGTFWDIALPAAAFEGALHGFAWLDDLAAVGDARARAKAQAEVQAWIARYGRGTGPGWTPDLTGRRLIRWISHALFLTRGVERAESEAFYRSLGQQTIFLSRRWKHATPGLPRIEALTGLIYAGLSLLGMERYVEPAALALGRDCDSQIDADGGLVTRNPEELLEVFTLLIWAAMALEESDRAPNPAHRDAITRVAPTLRALRHADGGLARFHGGGRGQDGRLDQALANSGVKRSAPRTHAMGYHRLHGGRTTLIIDIAPPPTGAASLAAHASTLAFELTSGRRPVIVNCGAGDSFGADWNRAGRATPSHSVLGIDGVSSAKLAEDGAHLVAGPGTIPTELREDLQTVRLEAAHDGYVTAFGLTHARQLELARDGRRLDGADLLTTLNETCKRRFDRALDRTALQGVPYHIRFHLHPDVDAALDMGGTAVSLALKSGEIWVFRHDGVAHLDIEPSVYLERGRLQPRATKQIVLSSRAMAYASRIRWSLAKAQDTPVSIRDLERDPPDEPDAPT